MPEKSPRDQAHWAKPVERLRLSGIPEGARNLIEGRRLMGPLQGFGQMWQKTYRVRLGDLSGGPKEVIQTWKEHYGDFWPPAQRFHAPLAGIEPGEIGLIHGGMGPIKASTGVMVIYADDTSFTFMNPEGHPWAGWITFSAFEDEGDTFAQVSLLIRANDPIYEIGFRFFGGNRFEDRMWKATLRNLAAHFGVDADPEAHVVLIDRRRQWRNIGNIRHNATLRTVLHTLAGPLRAMRRTDS